MPIIEALVEIRGVALQRLPLGNDETRMCRGAIACTLTDARNASSGVHSRYLRHLPATKEKRPEQSDLWADGGDKGSRTPDLLHAKQALYQLSYIPMCESYYSMSELKMQRILRDYPKFLQRLRCSSDIPLQRRGCCDIIVKQTQYGSVANRSCAAVL